MTRMTQRLAATIVAVLTAATVFAQGTTGSIAGRVVDDQQAAIPGAAVTATNAATGFIRAATSDAEGTYRLAALPVGTYTLTIELAGFKTISREGVVVNVSQETGLNFNLSVASVAETVQVTGETPLIQTTSSSVGGVVETGRIETLPLNGRQFANLAATIPGVGLGFHSDPTKSTQYAPQIGGGNGRNLNYQIDGGDNNDDTVGGLLQLFPLEAIQEFNVITSRYKAEYGRSNGGVMNIVTKSGTNDLHGSWFTLFRDESMNALTETQRLAKAEKPDYRRWQYGGSFGGPVLKNKLFYFGAFERTQQDQFQVVNTLGLFPSEDGTYATPYRETLLTVKATASLNAANYLSVRYGRNDNSQPYGANAQAVPSNWGNSKNKFNSINLNHNLVIGTTGLNEFIFQYADFANAITANSSDPTEIFPNNVSIGANGNTPQQTQQKKWQFRDDFSFYVSGKGGIGHSIKLGVNWIHEPTLFITFNTGTTGYTFTHLTNDLNGPIRLVTRNGGAAEANIPLDQYAGYIQDDWKVTDRFTVNLGLRYDYISGYQIDQSKNPNFVKIQAAGAAGLLKGIKGLENAGLSPKDDRNNFQPRIGFALDVRGDGKDVVRGGWGIYTDMGYTNSNLLFAAIDATGIGSGSIFNVDVPAGILKADGTPFRVTDPISTIASQNSATGSLPLFGQWLDPRLEMPYTSQFALGWSHELMASSVITVDMVYNKGENLNVRPRINTRPLGQPTGPRRLAFTGINPNAIGTRPGISAGRSEYKALILGFKRRMYKGVDFTATYTLADAKSTIGTAGDELNANNLQDAEQLYDDPRVFGPTSRTDSRHAGTIAAVIQAPWGITVSPFFIFRSALPVSIIENIDLNGNGELNDIPAKAYAFAGVGETPKETGDCETYNCGRGAKRTQFNLRASKTFRLFGRTRIEAIGEVFNLFDAKNPSGFRTQRLVGGAANPLFLQPTAYAGDFQQGEQRLGQVGVRFSF